MRTPNPVTLEYLAHLGKLGKTGIHPKGPAATTTLMNALAVHPDQRILDIGCGTGGTMTRLASRFRVRVDGIDILPEMLRVAKRRLRIAGSRHRTDVVRGHAGQLPFGNETYDRVYAESALGFHPSEIARAMVSEAFRILKPGGVFVANEAMWRAGTPLHTVSSIYHSSVADFGSAPASESAWGKTEWTTLFRQVGFIILATTLSKNHADRISPKPDSGTKILVRLRGSVTSRMYTLWLVTTRSLSPRVARAEFMYRRRMRVHRKDAKHLENVMFVLQKPTP